MPEDVVVCWGECPTVSIEKTTPEIALPRRTLSPRRSCLPFPSCMTQMSCFRPLTPLLRRPIGPASTTCFRSLGEFEDPSRLILAEQLGRPLSKSREPGPEVQFPARAIAQPSQRLGRVAGSRGRDAILGQPARQSKLSTVSPRMAAQINFR
jgi:hypothetical protein